MSNPKYQVVYVGKGTNDRVAQLHPNVSSGGSDLDPVLLAWRLESPVASVRHSLFLESVLLGLFGCRDQTEFESRMNMPAVLDNSIRKSVDRLDVRGLPISLVNFATWSRLDGRFLHRGDFDFTHYQYLRVSLRDSFDPRATLDQLMHVTCEWWRRPLRLTSKPLIILGLKNSFTRVGRIGIQIPVVASAFLVADGSAVELEDLADSKEARCSWKASAAYDAAVWQRFVGNALPHSVNIQGSQLISPDGSLVLEEGGTFAISPETKAATPGAAVNLRAGAPLTPLEPW